MKLSLLSTVVAASLLAACSSDPGASSDPASSAGPATPAPSGSASPMTDGGVDAGPRLGPAQPAGAVVLEADGTLITVGGVKLDTTGAPSWKGKDVARAVVALVDGSGGWVLDDVGLAHAFGEAPALSTGLAETADVARALVVLADEASGYVLEQDGTLHAFGKAPALTSTWASKGDARGLELHYSASGDPDGGWVLDAFGGVHEFGAATAMGAPPAYAGYDAWLQLHAVQGGAYAIGRYGVVEPVGKPEGVPLTGFPDTKGADMIRDVFPLSAAGAFDVARELSCPNAGAFCGADGLLGESSVLFDCAKKGVAPTAAKVCAHGCKAPASLNDYCAGVLSCAADQWWNDSINYGPTFGNGWYDTDIHAVHGTQVVLRHDSKLTKTGVYGWGYMPEFVDLVTGKAFRYLHLLPQHQLATNVGQVYTEGTVVGLSGGDTADTGLGTYSTGQHLCVQTQVDYRVAFPAGKDPCK